MKKIRIFVLSLCMCAALSASAQGVSTPKYHISIGYGFAVPTSEFAADYISQTSWRDFQAEFMWYLNPNLGVGALSGWQYFNQAAPSKILLPNPGTLIYGQRFNLMSIVPILARVDYVITPYSPLNVSIGAGIGTAHASQQTDIGIYTLTDDGFKFAWMGQLGLKFGIIPNLSLGLAAQYTWVLNGLDDFDAGKKMVQYFGLKLTVDFLGGVN